MNSDRINGKFVEIAAQFPSGTIGRAPQIVDARIKYDRQHDEPTTNLEYIERWDMMGVGPRVPKCTADCALYWVKDGEKYLTIVGGNQHPLLKGLSDPRLSGDLHDLFSSEKQLTPSEIEGTFDEKAVNLYRLFNERLPVSKLEGLTDILQRNERFKVTGINLNNANELIIGVGQVNHFNPIETKLIRKILGEDYQSYLGLHAKQNVESVKIKLSDATTNLGEGEAIANFCILYGLPKKDMSAYPDKAGQWLGFGTTRSNIQHCSIVLFDNKQTELDLVQKVLSQISPQSLEDASSVKPLRPSNAYTTAMQLLLKNPNAVRQEMSLQEAKALLTLAAIRLGQYAEERK